MTDRPTQYGAGTPVKASALDRPIAGLGRLLPGTHAVDVLSVVRTAAGRWTVVLQAPSRECHIETLADWPLKWVTGTQLRVDIVHSSGYVLFHSPRGFQARDAQTLEPRTEWCPTASDVYAKMLPVHPASTRVGKASDGTCDYVPVQGVHTAPDDAAGPQAGDAAPGVGV